MSPSGRRASPKDDKIPNVHHDHLLKYDDLPAWYQDSYSAKVGFRPISDSWLVSLGSLSYLHNETLNIYTHLLPASLFICMQFVLSDVFRLFHPDALPSGFDLLILRINILAAASTMILSSTYHLMRNHSPRVLRLALTLDYMGIPVLIFGDFISQVYVDFHCQPAQQRRYWMIILILGPMASATFLHPRMQGLEYRMYRIHAVVLIATSRFLPMLHAIWLYGRSELYERTGVFYWLLELPVYGIGGLFFLMRMPESIWPGVFDIWLSSHQICHLSVVVASLIHLRGVWNTLASHLEHPGCAITRA